MFSSISPFQLFNREKVEIVDKADFLRASEVLDFFFVSHPASGRKEGTEHRRVLYYYPENEMMDKQTDVTGFAEAIIQFTDSLAESADAPSTSAQSFYKHRYINSANQCQVVLEVEDGRKVCNSKDYVPHAPTLKSILSKMYETYRLFHGSFSRLVDSKNGGAERIKHILRQFFSQSIERLQFNKIPLVDLFCGVDFMPLSPVDFLDVNCMVSRCMEEFPQISRTVFIYQNQLIHYTVEKCDLIVLCQFLCQNLIPFSLQSELQPEIVHRTRSQTQCGDFISGVVDFLGEMSESQLPTIYLAESNGEDGSEKSVVRFELVAYRALNATFCMFLRAGSEPLDMDALGEFLDTKLSTIASKIGESVSTIPRSLASEVPFHFIYYNPDSLSLRTSLPSTSSALHLAAAQLPPPAIYQIICETYDNFVTDEEYTQIQVKAENDWWVIFRKNGGRVIAIFLAQTATATVVDVQETVDGILRAHFDHIFLAK